MVARIKDEVARTEYVYAHGHFEMVALRVTRDSSFTPVAHSDIRWVSRAELSYIELAPADVELVSQLAMLEDWR